MMFVVALLSLVALCASSAIPAVPGDNSHYVEGESRYIWMPDDQGTPILVDLQAPVNSRAMLRNDSSNEYWLFTSSNPTEYDLLVYDDADSVTDSNYSSDLPILVLIHGWTNTGNATWILEATAAQLEAEDINVIVLDWSGPASGTYTEAVAAVPEVGEAGAEFLEWLFETAGGSWTNTHVAGHSLGAHVAGNVGRGSSAQVARVSGLDPAGPLWYENEYALSTDCGVYVESIHTDGDFLGMINNISDADFYPNGGRNPQPGCVLSTCSHERAALYFAASLLYDSFEAYLCSDLSEAESVECTGSTFNMGNNDLTKSGSGIYGLTTNSTWPYYV